MIIGLLASQIQEIIIESKSNQVIPKSIKRFEEYFGMEVLQQL